MPGSKAALELVEVVYADIHGRKIFDGLNLNLNYGTTTIIFGPTGSGKTSLTELIIGAESPESGQVFLFGQKVKAGRLVRLAGLRRKIGGVGGIFTPISNLKVKDNIAAPLLFRRESNFYKRNKIEKALLDFGLKSRGDDLAGNLSQGEKILVMLARATVADQPLLLIDEPLAGLDGKIREKVAERLRRLALGGHSMLILTASENESFIPGARRFRLEEGKLA